MNKHAFSRDWLVRRGNRYVDQNFDRVMLDPNRRRKAFDRLTGADRPGLFSRMNPLSWVRNAYTADPRAQQHISQTLRTRLRDPQFVQRLFGGRQNVGQALAGSLGPLGMGAAGTGLAGAGALLTGRRGLGAGLGIAGVAGLGAQAVRQKNFATDPQSWARAFGSQADPGAKSRLHSLSTLYSSFAPQQAKTAEVLEVGGLKFVREDDGSYRRLRKPKEKQRAPLTVEELLQQHRPRLPTPTGYHMPLGLDLALNLGTSITGTRPPSWGPAGRIKLGLHVARVNRIQTDFGADRSTDAQRFLRQHFPMRSTVREIMHDPNISMGDKAQVLTPLLNFSPDKKRGAFGFREVIPSLIGAGVGYGGASAIGSLLNLAPTQRKAFRLGAAALGGVLNNPRIIK